jgi:peptide deformylase
MARLKIAEFGNPLLRRPCDRIKVNAIGGSGIQNLITAMRDLLVSKELGVGLAAPQIGKSLQLAVIAIRPDEHRPEAEKTDLVIINPRIIETYGRREQLYEGCISAGPRRAGLFAKVPRHKKIKLKYYDEKGRSHTKIFDGIAAHIIQHEVDHLKGILFVDKVKDTASYVTYKEYMKLVQAKRRKMRNQRAG